MLDLNAPKTSLEAQLLEARKGLAYYETVVTALELAIAQINTVNQAAGLRAKTAQKLIAKTAVKSKPQPAAKNAASKKQTAAKPTAAPVAKKDKKTPQKPAKKNTAASKAGGAGDLPPTGGDFWPSLVSAKKQSMSEILDAAFAKMGIEPTKARRDKLANRATFAINELVRKEKVKDEGAGRERRFFV